MPDEYFYNIRLKTVSWEAEPNDKEMGKRATRSQPGASPSEQDRTKKVDRRNTKEIIQENFQK